MEQQISQRGEATTKKVAHRLRILNRFEYILICFKTNKKLKLIPAIRKCLHFYFYFIDREFGFMHVRLQSWFPCPIQVCMNGREWLARKMDKAGIAYERRENCFAKIQDIKKAHKIADSMLNRNWHRLLDRFGKRFNPLLKPHCGLDALSVIGEEDPSFRLLDSVSNCVSKNNRRYRALRPIAPYETMLFQSVLHGEFLLHGFRNEHIRTLLFPSNKTEEEKHRNVARTSRLISLLRAHGLIKKITKTRLYRITQKGRLIMSPSLILRNTSISLLQKAA